MERVLVTGGAGFIGSHLVGALLQRGHSVCVLDNFSSGDRRNIEEYLSDIEVLDHPMGFCLPEVCYHATANVSHIFHLGAVPSVARSVVSPFESDMANVHGTLCLLEAARKRNVRRFIFASSSSVYGDCGALAAKEDAPLRPCSPYAASKIAGEAYVMAYRRMYGLESVCLRYFNVFGHRQNPGTSYAAAVSVFVRRFLVGIAPTVYGDGKQTRDFTYVDDVVRANILAMDSPGAPGELFNISSGESRTINDLVRSVQEITGRTDITPVYASPRPGDARHSRADISKALLVLGYAPAHDFHEALRRTVEFEADRLGSGVMGDGGIA